MIIVISDNLKGTCRELLTLSLFTKNPADHSNNINMKFKTFTKKSQNCHTRSLCVIYIRTVHYAMLSIHTQAFIFLILPEAPSRTSSSHVCEKQKRSSLASCTWIVA